MWVATERGMAAEDPKLSLCPERPRSNGRYADTRNPMQLGHLIFLADLGLFARSSATTFVAMAHIP